MHPSRKLISISVHLEICSSSVNLCTMLAHKTNIGDLLVEVSPAQTIPDGKTTSPEFRNVIAKDGFANLEGVSTLYESFQNRYNGFVLLEASSCAHVWRCSDRFAPLSALAPGRLQLPPDDLSALHLHRFDTGCGPDPLVRSTGCTACRWNLQDTRGPAAAPWRPHLPAFVFAA